MAARTLYHGSVRRTAMKHGFQSGDLECPKHHRKLQVSGDDLWCEIGCRRTIIEGVADLVPEDLDVAVKETIDTFSAKWDFDPAAVKEERQRIATKWFFDRVGEREISALLHKSRTVLDAGCGFGHLTTEFATRAPHAQVWGVDLSTAISRVTQTANMRLVRGDLTRLPTRQKFDLIVSDGVLHHTSDTREAVWALSKSLAPGGTFIFYVYRRKGPVREFCDTFIREHTTEMSTEECFEFAKAMASIGRQLREAKVTIEIEEPIDCLMIPAGTMDLQRFFYWNVMKCFWDDAGNMPASIIENFDWYHPKLAWRHTEQQVHDWIAEAGLFEKRVQCFDSGILAIAQNIRD